jgi:hypothetical protein
MRLIRGPLACSAAIALAAVLALAGCGTARSAGPPRVTVTLSAPTNGATVGVRTVFVAGTVTPTHAQVRIAGRRVRVRRGRFSRAIYLTQGTTRIRILARARGYRPARLRTTVHYSSRTANVMLLARRAATSVGSVTSLVSGYGSAGGSGSFTLLNSAAGRQQFMTDCNANSGDANPQGCTCLYDHLVRSGAFNSRSQELAQARQMVRAATAGDVTEMPISLRSAVVACTPQVLQTTASGGAPPG